MRVNFEKIINQNVTITVTVTLGLPKVGVLKPYLPVSSLYELIAYNSNPPIAKRTFTRLYSDFVKDSENIKFVIDEQLSFGRGGHKKVVLNTQGLAKFANEHSRKFQFCVASVENFIKACLLEFERIETHETSSQQLFNRIAPVQNQLPIDFLYQELLSGNIYDTEASEFSELQKVLNSTNTFYIMELADNYFRAGKSRTYFRTRLKKHTVYKSTKFIGFYGIYLFKESSLLDCATLESDFFLKAPQILGIDKLQIERCSSTNDFSFLVDNKEQIRKMLELCFVNTRIQYNGLVDPVINPNVLATINKKC